MALFPPAVTCVMETRASRIAQKSNQLTVPTACRRAMRGVDDEITVLKNHSPSAARRQCYWLKVKSPYRLLLLKVVD